MGLDLFLEFAYSSKPEAVFSVLGIDSSNLDFSAFGPGKEKKGKYATIYGRMLRAVIKGTISYFYMKNASRVFVDRLFHDEEGNLENSIWFDHQTINLTQRELFNKYIDVSFFPSKRISDTTAKSSLFYKNRYPKQTIYGNKQIF